MGSLGVAANVSVSKSEDRIDMSKIELMGERDSEADRKGQEYPYENIRLACALEEELEHLDSMDVTDMIQDNVIDIPNDIDLSTILPGVIVDNGADPADYYTICVS